MGDGQHERDICRVCGPRRRIRAEPAPITTPAPPLTLAPVAITNDSGRPYDAAHAPEAGSPFVVYDHLVAYDIPAAAFTDLPQEPNCPCGAAFSADGRIFARLEAPDGRGPFALHVWNLPTNADFSFPRRTWPTGWLAI